MSVPQAVDPLTGEVIGVTVQHFVALRSELARKDDIITGLERQNRRWAYENAELKRDKAQEAREHAMWPVITLLYRGWQVRCGHPDAPFTSDRFWAAEPFLRSRAYGKTLEDRVVKCCQAIAGAQHDPFRRQQKNQSWVRYDDWAEQIFKSAGKFESFCARAPAGWEPMIGPGLRKAMEHAERRTKAIAKRKREERNGSDNGH